MNRFKSLSRIFVTTFAAVSLTVGSIPPATAQDYWEYEPWEGEWERHFPGSGLEYEYDDGEVEVEAEQYEWESPEGYHEQEWYDPSDWFEYGRDLEYESDGYYDEYYTEDWYDGEPVFDRWYAAP